MDKLIVLLDQRDITVRTEGKVLRVERPERPPERIPMNMISRVIVYGSPMVSCDVWRKLADEAVPAVLFPGRGSGGPACLGSGLSTSVMIRITQHRAAGIQQYCIATARYIVDSKLHLMEKFLLAFEAEKSQCLSSAIQRNVERKMNSLTKTIQTIRQCRSAVKSADNLNEIRGYEGSAAMAWFGFLAEILPEKLKFSGRNRRPPRDPVNALLSLSYTMALAEVRHAVHQRGLDPGVGYLHTPRSGRESLLLDLLELCRPAVDAFVLGLISGILQLSHFYSSKQYGCRLTKEGRALYYRQWAAFRIECPVWFLDINQEDDDKETTQMKTMAIDSMVQKNIKKMTDIWQPITLGDETVWVTC